MIQVINRAFDMLEYLAKEPGEPKTLGEIAGDLKLNAGTCANILKTMVGRNYVHKLDRQRGYVLGSKLEGFTGYEATTKNLITAAQGEVERLTKQTNENAVLGVLKEDKRIVLARSFGSHDLQANTATEKRAYAASTGRLLVAMLSTEAMENFVTRYGLPTAEEWPEAADKKSFLKQLKQIQQDEYATQVTKGQIIGFAVAVFHHKKAVASLSVYMPLTRYNKQPQALLKLLNTAAKKIEKSMK